MSSQIWPIMPRARGNTQATVRWLDPVVWTLLAISFFVRGLGGAAEGAANVLAHLAALAYVPDR